MKNTLLFLFCLIAVTAGATDVLVDLNDFGANPAAGRTVTWQYLQPIPSNLFTNVTDDNGQFTISNAKVADYAISIRAMGSAAKIDFQITVTATDLGTVNAKDITSQLGIQTYPTAAKSSWTIAAADTRYQLAGTTLSNTFYPLFSNPSNYATLAPVTNLITGVSNSLYSDYTTKLALGLTNAYGTNTLTVSVAGQRIYIPTNFDAAGAAATVGLNLTNTLNSASNSLQGGIASFISAGTATNISAYVIGQTNLTFSSLVYTNPVQVLMTNTLPGLTNGYVDRSITNNYTTIALLNSASNSLQGQIVGGAVTLSQVTNVNNGAGGVIATNGASLTFKFTAAATNAISAATNGYPWGTLYDAAGAATAATNAAGIPSQLAAYVSTNRFAPTNSPVLFNPTSFGGGSTNSAITNASQISAYGAAKFTGLFTVDNGTFGTYFKGNSGIGVNQLIGITDGAEYVFTDNSGNFYFGDQSTLYSGAMIHIWGGTLQGDSPATNGYVEILNKGSQTSILDNGHGAASFNYITNLGVYYGDGSGISNVQPSRISITNAYGTNALTLSIANQAAYIPTNFDIKGGSNFLFSENATASNFNASANITSSNWLQAVKVDKTNSFSVGQIASNLVTEGNLSFGLNGLATNFLASTNFVEFYNAGSSLATNGTFAWNGSVYTNPVVSAYLTNNSSAWLMITNGVTLYSLSGASLAGQWSAVNGAIPAPLSVYSGAINFNGIGVIGYLNASNIYGMSNSVLTNIQAQITNAIVIATNNLNVIITNGTSSGSIAVNNGYGTNTSLQFVRAAWGISNVVSADYSAALAGASNTVAFGSPGFSAIVGGNYNVAGSDHDFVGGGLSNSIVGGYDVINGGFDNTMGLNASYNVIGGGYNNIIGQGILIGQSAISGGMGNKIITGSNSTIPGGQSNSIYGSFAIASGRNATASNNAVFVWSDGTVAASSTNSSVIFMATNGMGINTNYPASYTLNVNGSINASSIAINGTAMAGVTNASAFTTVTASGLHTLALNKGWTNNLGARADIVLNITVTDAATGVPILGFTNTITGESYTNSVNFGIAATPTYNINYIDISPNDYGSLSNYSTGSGASITINSATWKLK